MDLMKIGAQIVLIKYNAKISKECREDVHEMINGQSDWSFPMLDAMGKIPAGLIEGSMSFVGSYDQCLEVVATDHTSGQKRFQGEYCLITFGATKQGLGISIQGMVGGMSNLGIPLIWHGCFPSTCTDSDVLIASNMLFGPLGMNFMTATCEVKKDVVFDTSQIVAIVIFSILGFFLLTGTVLDVCFILKEKIQKSPSDSNKGNVFQALIAFSLYTNAIKILNTKTSADNLGALNGVRFLSMTWIIIAHSYSTIQVPLVGNLIASSKMTSGFAFQVLANGTVSVDVFFFLSGLLLAYVAMKEFKKNGKINWFLYYFHRIWRLTPALGLTILLIFLLPLFGSGPLWNLGWNAGVEACRNSWWKTLLYIQNFFRDQTCLVQSWYLADDMQFYVVSPVIIYFLWRWLPVGLIINGAFMLVSIVMPGVLIAKDNYLPTLLPLNGQRSVLDFNFYVYVKPWCRMAPYCIGIYFGYLLSTQRKPKIHPIVQALFWCLSIATCLAVLYGTYEWNNNNLSSKHVHAFYGAIHRPAFALGIAWMMYACCTGYGGIINSILSWEPFIPLGRMTYMAYLLHPSIIYLLNCAIRERIIISQYYMVVTSLGFLVITYGASFATSISFEAPFINLEKVIFGRGKEKYHKHDQIIKENEFNTAVGESNSAFASTEEKSLHL